MASEDSDQIVPGFSLVHRLPDLDDLRQSRRREVAPASISSTQRANFSKSERFAVRSGCRSKNGMIVSTS
jgi:hypothetical protein